MKTLKQLLNEAQDQYGYASTENIITEVKEWLTQKRLTTTAEPTYARYKEKLIVNEFINQLLEELRDG